jgi:dipeptidase D
MSLVELEPKIVWKHFNEIRKIPHCSGSEEKLADYILSFAEEKGIEAEKDSTGNVVVRVPATPGHEDAETIVLQGHIDMVCEKDSDVEHDFSSDPIEVEIQGEWVTAKGTTLGADNGIGVAASLAMAESEDVEHGPLELLFTVDEEVGLVGAGSLKPGFVTGRTLINLDSEEIGEVYIGCAGGGDSTIKLHVDTVEAPFGTKSYKLKVAGLKGGHSGIDINAGRGNAIKIATHTLSEILENQPCHVVAIRGGSKRNAIPRECEADLMILETAVDDVSGIVKDIAVRIKEEFKDEDPDLNITLNPGEETFNKVLSGESQGRMMKLLNDLPHGVHAMSKEIEDLVETSNNVATIATGEEEVVIGTSTRSSIADELESLRQKIKTMAEEAGAEIDIHEAYPGWKPNLESKILATVKDVHTREFGEEPKMMAIHAGLECGIIGEKYEGMDMVSFGPWIQHPHSPGERVNIPSVEQFWQLVVAVAKEVS